MPELGHVVFYVRRLAPMLAFYTDGVGLTPRGSIFNKAPASCSPRRA